MSMRALLTVVFLISIAIAFACTRSPQKAAPQAIQGAIDLSTWNFETDGQVRLSGEWEFYWNRILMQASETSASNGFINLPSTWNGTKIDGKELGGDGVASYRLKIKMPQTNGSLMAIRMLSQLTAYDLLVDGNRVCGSGQVGNSPETSVPETRPITCLFSPGSESLELILHVSNFHHRKGGVFRALYLGAAPAVIAAQSNDRMLDMLLCGVLVIMSLYHFALFYARRTDPSTIVFALICLTILFRTATTGEKVLTVMFPSVPFSVYTALEYISYFFGSSLGLHFIYGLYSSDLRSIYYKVAHGLAILFTLVVLFTPLKIYSNTATIYTVPLFVELAILFLQMARVIVLRRENAGLIITGLLLLLVAIINDVLNTTEVLHTGYIVIYGFMALVFCHSTVLSFRFSRAFSVIENLTSELQSNNLTLEKRVEERTVELRESKEVAEKANNLKDKFLSLVAHDLRSPIGSVYNLLELFTDPAMKLKDEEKQKFLEQAKTSLLDSLTLMENLLHFNRFRTGTLVMQLSDFDASAMVSEVANRISPLGVTKKIQIKNEVETGLRLRGDYHLICEIVLNFLSNAIKFSNEGQPVVVTSSRKNGFVFISVKDHGAGVDASVLPKLFNREQRVTRKGTKGEKGTGLGLILCHEIAEAHGGEIKVESSPNGSTFSFSIPEIADANQRADVAKG